MNKREGVFSKLKILAYSWAVVGPLTMKFFADHGATVIRILRSVLIASTDLHSLLGARS